MTIVIVWMMRADKRIHNGELVMSLKHLAFSAVATLIAVPLLLCQTKPGVTPGMSEATQACVECHKSITPGIVGDWLSSIHAQTNPAAALRKPPVERRISADEIAQDLRSVVVGCYECHGLNASSHSDNFEHFGYMINVVVSPNDCRVCHPTEQQQYAGSKKAHAHGILKDNPVYHTLLETIDGVKSVAGSEVRQRPASESTKHETCYGCHGTTVEVRGTRTVSSPLGDLELPNLTNWPSQGVGRVNPDGSLGACTACHPRHSFSIEIARKPFTCAQCHLEPDVPAWDVYRESKHGNIVLSGERDQQWTSVPWKVGKDLRAPTCATCHNSLLASPDGELIVERTHDFGARLWVRIFGIIYSHPQPKNGNTALIRNHDNLPLPTTFGGRRAENFLIEKSEQERRQSEMRKVCSSCHASGWSAGVFAKLDQTLVETDSMVLASTLLLQDGWSKKLADQSNPFDEELEKLWIKQWLFYANSVRYGSAMGGPDYAAFKHGWWDLSNNLEEMRDYIRHYGPKR